MTETSICPGCRGLFTYDRKYRPRIYCADCRPPVSSKYKDPLYFQNYYLNVLKPKRMALVSSQDRGTT